MRVVFKLNFKTRGRMAGLIGWLMLSLLVVGCADTTPTAPPSPTPLPTPTIAPTATAATSADEITYDFQPEVSTGQQQQIKRGIDLAIKTFGKAGSIRVFGQDNHTQLYKKANDDPLGSAIPGEILINTADQQGIRQSQTELLITTFHEYYHEVQFYLAGITFVNFEFDDSEAGDIRPNWLVEGQADYMAFKLADSARLYPFETIRARKVDSTRRSGLTLGGLEKNSKSGGDGAYTLGFLATDYLVNNYGGVDKLNKYWKALNSAPRWETVFEKTFGVSLGDFYAKFDQWRNRQFPVGQP